MSPRPSGRWCPPLPSSARPARQLDNVAIPTYTQAKLGTPCAWRDSGLAPHLGNQEWVNTHQRFIGPEWLKKSTSGGYIMSPAMITRTTDTNDFGSYINSWTPLTFNRRLRS